MKLNWKAVALVALMGCATTKNQGEYQIGYQSFECMGNCPVYKVRIDDRRNLTFEGIKNSKEGFSNDKLSKTEYERIVQLVRDLSDGDAEGPKLTATDAGGKELEVIIGTEKKVFAMESNNPKMIKLDSLMNQVLSSRGLISD